MAMTATMRAGETAKNWRSPSTPPVQNAPTTRCEAWAAIVSHTDSVVWECPTRTGVTVATAAMTTDETRAAAERTRLAQNMVRTCEDLRVPRL